MITIDKAIRDLQARVDGEFSITGIDNCEDMKLGIEALIFTRNVLKLMPIVFPLPLPGETKE